MAAIIIGLVTVATVLVPGLLLKRKSSELRSACARIVARRASFQEAQRTLLQDGYATEKSSVSGGDNTMALWAHPKSQSALFPTASAIVTFQGGRANSFRIIVDGPAM